MERKLKLLAVLAHPDDESLGFGGTLARYAAEGVETYLVTATRGEAGRFGERGKSGDPAEVGRVREDELHAAAHVLGIREVSILQYPDGAVDQVPYALALRDVVAHPSHSARCDCHFRTGRRVRPSRPHRDFTIHRRRRIVCSRSRVPSSSWTRTGFGCFPSRREAIPIGMAKRKWEAYQRAFRKLTSTVDGVERQATPWPDWAVTTEIDTSAFWPTVWKAVCRHQTQMSIYERLQDLTAEQQIALWGSQEFYRVFSSVNGGRKLETDLFEGLR